MSVTYRPLDISNADELKHVQRLIDADLSEPYSVYVYRYFLNQWPELCYFAFSEGEKDPVGCVVCKYDDHRGARLRGYIGMLAVAQNFRRRGIAKQLVAVAIEKMQEIGCDEVMLETEVENTTALSLYEGFGFIRLKRMFRYYLNQGDAFKLILPLTEKSCTRTTFLLQPETAFVE
ncbi:LANO_0E06590g1_1 [Lachancea nothofagi CBS 11611]|uniref:LANO_0E06590g1_1 n=1 Tax=Lachancea nothofagi CBS 11611 TaxID=1266666 RepID=A0A1G4JTX9_9SACH|nr:LANO_0E06590g1_1 [Lachancea nothofagi CBS 11611]